MEDAGDLDKMTEDDLKILFVSEVGLPRKNNTKSSFGFHIFTTLYILYYIILYYIILYYIIFMNKLVDR